MVGIVQYRQRGDGIVTQPIMRSVAKNKNRKKE